MAETEHKAAPGAGFSENLVDADGFRIRYREAGDGAPLVHLHGAGGLRLTPAHDLLARHFRVIAFEMPGFGLSPENSRTKTMADLASTMARAVSSSVDFVRPSSTAVAPRPASLRAIAEPIPRPAPVTTDTCPVRGCLVSIPLVPPGTIVGVRARSWEHPHSLLCAS